MSVLVYNEPYKFSAALLTLIMHVLFFSVLYLGVNWSTQQPEGMVVDLWGTLPESGELPATSAPPPPPPAESPKPRAAEKIAPPVKADIEVADKKKRPAPKKKTSRAEQRQALAEMDALGKQMEQTERQEQMRRSSQAAAKGAAIAGEVGKYKGLIGAKIRHYIVMPPDVADNAVAEFDVTLLPDGSVLDAKLRKSSGHAAYDDAVARAIKKAEPLPLPQDEAARKLFINPNQLKFKFSPKDGE